MPRIILRSRALNRDCAYSIGGMTTDKVFYLLEKSALYDGVRIEK